MTDLEQVRFQARKLIAKFKKGSIRNLAVRASNFRPKPQTKLGIDSFFQNLLEKGPDSKPQSSKAESVEATEGFRKPNDQRVAEERVESEERGRAQRPIESVVESNDFMLKETELRDCESNSEIEKPEMQDPDFCNLNALKTKKKRTNNEFDKEIFHEEGHLNDEEIYQIMEQEKTKKSSFESKRIFKNNQFVSKINSKTVNTRPVDTERAAIIKHSKRHQLSRASLSHRLGDSKKTNQSGKRSLHQIEALLSKRGQDGIGDSDDPDLIDYVGK